MSQRLVVTGGSSGIGRAIAERGVEAGWDVIVIDRTPSPIGRSLLADLSNIEGTAAALELALADGPITRLVNNVGAVFPASVEKQKYMSEIEFVSSAIQGDLVEMGLTAINFGTTSLTMRAEVRNMITRSSILTIDKIVFVNLGSTGRPETHGYSSITYSRDRVPDGRSLS